jgi:aquaporin Z
LTELIGTFFLVFTIGLSVLGGTPMAPLAIGTVLMVMVYMGGHVSGGHYNPAVSLAVLLRGKLQARDAVPYMAAQVLGAVAAAAVVYVVLGRTFAPAPAETASAVGALLVEVLYTTALCLVVLHSATAPQTTGNSFYGLAIGFTVAAGAFAGGPISGGAFNPAVGIGPILVSAVLGGGSLANLWLYLVGPFVGGALAAAVYRVQQPAEATPQEALAARADSGGGAQLAPEDIGVDVKRRVSHPERPHKSFDAVGARRPETPIVETAISSKERAPSAPRTSSAPFEAATQRLSQTASLLARRRRRTVCRQA